MANGGGGAAPFMKETITSMKSIYFSKLCQLSQMSLESLESLEGLESPESPDSPESLGCTFTDNKYRSSSIYKMRLSSLFKKIHLQKYS